MALSLTLACGLPHPSDAELLVQFQRHRPELEELVRMFRADKGLGRVGDGFTRPADPVEVGVSADRIAAYRRLCADVGASDCIEGYDASYDRLYASSSTRPEMKDPIWIHVSSFGLSISGSAKGYLYTEKPGFPVVADLDAVQSTRSGTWLRHMEGAWYLYYDFED
jgi:hypothetical protein